ncbi:hypothetical protein SAMN05428981_103392 [Bacillus sp. OV194]|nr:hypothetical protein SAMN05428981_103392 [Bacillus sp. OV194]
MKFKQARSIIQMSMILRVLRNLKTPKKSWEQRLQENIWKSIKKDLESLP